MTCRACRVVSLGPRACVPECHPEDDESPPIVPEMSTKNRPFRRSQVGYGGLRRVEGSKSLKGFGVNPRLQQFFTPLCRLRRPSRSATSPSRCPRRLNGGSSGWQPSKSWKTQCGAARGRSGCSSTATARIEASQKGCGGLRREEGSTRTWVGLG